MFYLDGFKLFWKSQVLSITRTEAIRFYRLQGFHKIKGLVTIYLGLASISRCFQQLFKNQISELFKAQNIAFLVRGVENG